MSGKRLSGMCLVLLISFVSATSGAFAQDDIEARVRALEEKTKDLPESKERLDNAWKVIISQQDILKKIQGTMKTDQELHGLHMERLTSLEDSRETTIRSLKLIDETLEVNLQSRILAEKRLRNLERFIDDLKLSSLSEN